jgi:hypothetical protein
VRDHRNETLHGWILFDTAAAGHGRSLSEIQQLSTTTVMTDDEVAAFGRPRSGK